MMKMEGTLKVINSFKLHITAVDLKLRIFQKKCKFRNQERKWLIRQVCFPTLATCDNRKPLHTITPLGLTKLREHHIETRNNGLIIRFDSSIITPLNSTIFHPKMAITSTILPYRWI